MSMRLFNRFVYAACISIHLFLFCFVEIQAKNNTNNNIKLNNQYLCMKLRMNIEYVLSRLTSKT